MLLAVDNGNTNVKFALVDGGGAIVQRWRIATDARRTADEYAVWLDQLLRMEGHARSDVSAVIIATVVPRALHNLQMLASKYFGTEALIAGHRRAGTGGGREDRDQLRHRDHFRLHRR
jgi:type III pantothenate kinase